MAYSLLLNANIQLSLQKVIFQSNYIQSKIHKKNMSFELKFGIINKIYAKNQMQLKNIQ